MYTSMSSSEIVIKIRPDGKLLIERGSDNNNTVIYEALSHHVLNRQELSNFLFQWPKREILQGEGDLCG